MAGMATIWLPGDPGDPYVAPGILFRVRHGLVPATNLQRSGAKRKWYSHKLIKMNEMDMDSDMKWFKWWHDDLVPSLSGASSGWVGYNMGWAYQVELWIIWILTHLDTSWQGMMRPCSVQGILHFAFQKDLLVAPLSMRSGRGTTCYHLLVLVWETSGKGPENHMASLQKCASGHLPSWHKTCSTNSINIINCSSMVLPATCTLSSTGIGSGVQMVFSTYRKLGETPGKVLGI